MIDKDRQPICIIDNINKGDGYVHNENIKSLRYYEHMTEEMHDVVEYTLNKDRLEREFEECYLMYTKANKAANVSLPCKAANGGDVLHGARKEVKNMSDYWKLRLEAVSPFLSRDWMLEKEKELNDLLVNKK